MPTERYPETALACEEDISTPMAVGVLALQGSFKEHIVCEYCSRLSSLFFLDS